MTTQAPSLHTPTDAASTVTLPVSDLEPVLDAFALLDHRAQRRAIKAGLAPSGQYLAIEDGEETLLLRLESRITHIGRSGACEIRFEDPRVSRDHAILVRQGRYARVLDNRSSNGTFLNGRPIVATNIRHGDVLRIGPIVLQYVEIP